MSKHLLTAAVFGDDMVLQSGKPLPVWGTAQPGAVVRCALNGQTAQTCADETGAWQLTLPAMPCGGPYQMTVTTADACDTFDRVYIGEVWLAGGQSNMELELQNSENGKAELAACENPFLHFYQTPKVADPAALEAAEAAAAWHTAASDTAATFSAVAYYAAKTLAAHLPGIHIGVVGCYWGGTFAHCWIDRDALAQTPEGRARIAEYDTRIGDKTDAEFAAELAAYDLAVQGWNDRVAALRVADPAVSWPQIDRDCGLFPWPPPAGRTGYQRPGNLYQTMLRRICQFAVRGVWYYQGEQDEDKAGDYRAMLTLLVQTWRRDWGERLPFVLVQLPMFIGTADAARDPMRWPVLRAAQQRVRDELPDVELVPLTDCGEFDNIHPIDKKTPGTRLGLLTLEAVYAQPVTGRAPVCTGAEFSAGTVTLHFAHTGGGLTLAGRGQGFELAEAGGAFAPAEAHAVGDTVTLTAPGVPTPTQARYAWFSYGPADLHGGTGLAVAPFWVTE